MLGDDIKVGDKIKFNALVLESINNKSHNLYKYVGKVLTITEIQGNYIGFMKDVNSINRKYFDKHTTNIYVGIKTK